MPLRPVIFDEDGEAMPIDYLESFQDDSPGDNFSYSIMKFFTAMPRTRVIEYRSGSERAFYVIKKEPAPFHRD